MIVVFMDIDKTVSDAWWREGLVGEWDSYHSAGKVDKAFHEMVWLANNIPELVMLTSRPEKYRSQTQRWLIDNCIPAQALLMRPDDDYRTTALVKYDLVMEYMEGSKDCIIIDDDDRVVSKFREEGYCVLQSHINKRSQP